MSGTLILLRHGQSQTNAAGLFTGLLDTELTDAGRNEAMHAAELLTAAQLSPDIWLYSPLLCARQTAEILATVMPQRPDCITDDWRLAERNYGALTGCSKHEVLDEYGEERFRTWRRSLHVEPPAMSRTQRGALDHVPDALGLTESLHDVIVRVTDVWHERIEPVLKQDEAILIKAHGNSLRALCTVIDQLDEREVRDLNVPTGYPLLYEIDEESRPLMRGGYYLDQTAAKAAAVTIAREGGT
ncbi:2,3-bisphosphoglycerate-dependent phosphoglycerate mutase [Rothia uropygialis]|uniref:2,3-bisphosphoglycerate-dependent phosphoglycerate mutase n=1 Tax=Kocuria sp. 36 TaxID=1415402 RepID=UPI00101D4FAA|nr:2,3-bisphosphoglycerate-dependent phosphoglycerate mutase [Kocuria sp. 36]